MPTYAQKCRISVTDDVHQLPEEETGEQIHQRRPPEIGRVRKQTNSTKTKNNSLNSSTLSGIQLAKIKKLAGFMGPMMSIHRS